RHKRPDLSCRCVPRADRFHERSAVGWVRPVSPEVTDCLNRARSHLEKARNFLNILQYSDEAARAAYLAGFNSAQALVFTRRGRIAKTHRGLRSTFAELVTDQPGLDPSFMRFLAEAYRSKENVDMAVAMERRSPKPKRSR